MTRTILAAFAAALFVLACNGGDDYQTDDAFALQTVIWTCEVTCVGDDGGDYADQVISCAHSLAVAEEDAKRGNAFCRENPSINCTTANQVCENTPQPASPAW